MRRGVRFLPVCWQFGVGYSSIVGHRFAVRKLAGESSSLVRWLSVTGKDNNVGIPIRIALGCSVAIIAFLVMVVVYLAVRLHHPGHL